MKAFRIISLALAAVFMAACFTACSKMENDEPQKRLAKITFSDSPFSFSYTFNYDDKGLLKNSTLEIVVYSESNSSTYIDSYNYIWNSQSIDVAVTSSHEGIITEQYEYTYHMSEGLIRSKNHYDGITPDFSFGYDSSNRLIRFDTEVIEWNNDKLTSIKMDTEHVKYTVSYTYGNTPSVKGYSPLVPLSVSGDALILTHPELAGLMTNKIPETETVLPNDTHQQTRFEYEFDKDGYISRIHEISTQTEGESWSTEYTIVWE